MKNRGGFKVSVGISSLLMIFVVLALTTFSVLGYVTANSDYKLADKTAEGVSSYYNAEIKAENFLAAADREICGYMEQIREIERTRKLPDGFLPENEMAKMRALLNSGATGNSFYQRAYQIVMAIYWQLPHDKDLGKFTQDEMTLTAEFEVDSSRKLVMKVKLAENPFEGGARYTVVKRALVSTLEYEEDKPLDLYQGEGGAQ